MKQNTPTDTVTGILNPSASFKALYSASVREHENSLPHFFFLKLLLFLFPFFFFLLHFAAYTLHQMSPWIKIPFSSSQELNKTMTVAVKHAGSSAAPPASPCFLSQGRAIPAGLHTAVHWPLLFSYDDWCFTRSASLGITWPEKPQFCLKTKNFSS